MHTFIATTQKYLRPPERRTGSSVRGSSKSQKNWEIFNIENRVRASGPTTDEWAQLRLGVEPEINVYEGAVKAPVYIMRMMTGARFQRMRRAGRVAQKRISSDKKHQTPPCKCNQQYWCFDLIISVTYFGCGQNPQNCIRKVSCILEPFAPARQSRTRWMRVRVIQLLFVCVYIGKLWIEKVHSVLWIEFRKMSWVHWVWIIAQIHVMLDLIHNEGCKAQGCRSLT